MGANADTIRRAVLGGVPVEVGPCCDRFGVVSQRGD
jgi:hypothetical protein